jgi:hypothetical protein
MLALVNDAVLAVLPNTSRIEELSTPATAAGPPAVRFLLGSVTLVTVSLTVEPLSSVFAVTLADVPPTLL